jgi:hypothetical protein
MEYGRREEDFLVTFQVAVAARDGWIMASDTKENRYVGIASKRIRETTHTKKIAYDSATRTTYMVSGDDTARDAAKDVVNRVKAFGKTYPDFEWLENELPSIVSAQWTTEIKSQPPSPRKAIFAFDNSRPFWELWIDKWSKMERIYTKVWGGDETNSAKFFLEHYYSEDMSVRELLPLVAHTILMGGEINPSGVGGLEISFWEDGVLVQWDTGSPELKILETNSDRVASLIREHLTKSDLVT